MQSFLHEGKLDNDTLKLLVLDKLNFKRKEVVLRAGVGEDCAALDLDGLCVVTADPITAAASDMGSLCVHVCANDLASAGAEPVAMFVTALLPVGTEMTEVDKVFSSLAQTASELNIEIAGGHTEITSAVVRTVLCATMLGISDKLISTAGAQPGDDIIFTKTAGIEGTLIILSDFSEKADCLTSEERTEALAMKKCISVLPEGRIGARMGVHSMHDVTEGGVLGAVHEMCIAAGVGAEVSDIPVAPSTAKLCAHLKIDPLRLISSGSMLMACSNGPEMLLELNKVGIQAQVIGRVTENLGILHNGVPIKPPSTDELYKLF